MGGDLELVLGRLCLSDGSDVGKVLRTAGGELVGDEISSRDGACRKVAIDQDGYAVGIDVAKSMPSICWITSKQMGGTPKRAMVFPSAKSATVNVVSGAPNSARALYVARAFSGLDSMNTSRSLVMRGWAWIKTA